jgi:hypothetical protein
MLVGWVRSWCPGGAGRGCAGPVAGGTQAAWATESPVPPPVETRRRLVIHATVPVLAPAQRPLQARARELGFTCLAGYLADRYVQREHSLRRIAHELGTTIHVVRGLRDRLQIRSHGGIRARGRSRQAANDRHAAARAVELGFTTLRDYLSDRYTTRAWTIPQLAGELGVGKHVVQRLLRTLMVARTRAPVSIAAAAARGRARSAELVARRRQDRLAELGFDGVEEYVWARLGRGWSVRRMCAELGVGSAWLRGEVARLRQTP